MSRKLKAQFKAADSFGAKYIITLGETEAETRQLTIKNNSTREEKQVSFDELLADAQTILSEF